MMDDAQPLLVPAAAAAAVVKPKDTFWACVANLSKVIIGAGMMAIPQAYCRIGSVAGSTMLVGVGVMTYCTLVFLLRGSEVTGAATYSQLTNVLCGVLVMKVLQVAVLSFCFGFGVVYLVIIRDILLGTPPHCNGLLCELLGLSPTSSWYDGRLVITAVALLVCCPLLLLRTMDRLALLNVVGVGAIGLLAVTALGLAAKGVVQGSAHAIPWWPQWQQLGHTTAEQLQALMAVVPVMIACYVAHQSLHPLMPLLQPYSDTRMRGVIAVALMVSFAVFGSLAVGSSLAFGPDLQVNVLTNYSVPGLEPLIGPVLARMLSWVIRGGYLLSLLASLLLYMHPLRACLAEMIWSDDSLDDSSPQQQHQQQQPNSTGQPQLPPDMSLAREGPAKQGGRDHVPSSGGARAANSNGVSSTAVDQAVSADVARQPSGESAFASAAAQAAAASNSTSRASSGGGSSISTPLPMQNSKPLSTFDSLDNPRTGSWSGVRYLPQGAASIQADSPQKQLPDHLQQARQAHNSGGSITPAQSAGQGRLLATGASGDAVLRPVLRAGHDQGVQVVVEEVPGAGSPGAVRLRWQQAEQVWYYWLTYGLLAAMVLVAIAVPNIWAALSVIGDLASTLQAFVVPGLIGITLAVRTTKTARDSRVHVSVVASCAVGVIAVLLGLGLFVNGIYQRV